MLSSSDSRCPSNCLWLLVVARYVRFAWTRKFAAARGLRQAGEHALAFLRVDVVLGFAYTERRPRTAIIVVVWTGLIELLQLIMRLGNNRHV